MTRLSECGRTGVTPGGSVRLRASGTGEDRRAGFAGVSTCGSVWACPVCSAKILAHRQAELEAAIGQWTAAGNSLVMVTLTMRHRRGQRLRTLWDALGQAWEDVTRNGSYRRVRDALGVAGFARAVEVTYGEAGWHVHVHAALFVRGEVGRDAAESIESAVWGTWRSSLTRAGLDAPLRGPGIDVKLWRSDGAGRLGEYFTKASYDHGDGASAAAAEVARGDLKAARSGNRTPFQVLADFDRHGDADDLDVWHEWEDASRGRRQLTWSRKLRAELALSAERSDDELAADEAGTADDDLVEFDAATWRYIGEHGLHGFLLDAAEDDDDGTALRAYLDARGLPYRDVRPWLVWPVLSRN